MKTCLKHTGAAVVYEEDTWSDGCPLCEALEAFDKAVESVSQIKLPAAHDISLRGGLEKWRERETK